MRYYKNNKAPFPLGIYFEDQKIGSAAFEQLQKANMIPNESNPCVDIYAKKFLAPKLNSSSHDALGGRDH